MIRQVRGIRPKLVRRPAPGRPVTASRFSLKARHGGACIVQYADWYACCFDTRGSLDSITDRDVGPEQRLRLSQPDAISAMLAACLCSADELTRELGKQLAAYSEQPSPVPRTPTSPTGETRQASIRTYRGQRVMS